MTNRSYNQGIAIGAILMVVALMAVIAGLIAAGGSTMSTNTIVDRIKVELKGQANLIRSKVQECYMITMGNESFGYPAGSNTPVRNLTCPGDPSGAQNLWTGARPVSLSPMLSGLNEWVYYNYSGGRCIMVVPTSADGAVRQGLVQLATQYNATEVNVATGSDYALSIWLTPKSSPGRCGS